MNRAEFLNLMATAQLAYGNKLSEKSSRIYWDNLKHIDAQDAEVLMQKHIDTERFFPRISDLKPMRDTRPQLGPRYIEPPQMSKYVKQANKVMLGVLVRVGGVQTSTIKAWKEVKTAMVEDAERDQPGHPEFAGQMENELLRLLKGHEGRTE